MKTLTVREQNIEYLGFVIEPKKGRYGKFSYSVKLFDGNKPYIFSSKDLSEVNTKIDTWVDQNF